MNVLVTGGAGYIGSHAAQRLLRDGHRVIVVDSLVRGHAGAMDALQRATKVGSQLVFVQSDVSEQSRVEGLLREHRVSAVMHFAALAAVGESVDRPLWYYRNNVSAMIALLSACESAGVERFVFSSSCATYGNPPEGMVPIPEHCPKAPISPYGMTKLHGEHILEDFARGQEKAGKPFGFTALRYFNVAGCDRSGVLGEDHDPETHLIPVVLHAAMGRRNGVAIFGTDYLTPDGTCIRDYIHVEDLIDAHVKSLHAIKPGTSAAYNLGIGRGYSVREIIAAVREVTGCEFAVREEPRREGDPPRLFADPRKIQSELGWRASITDLRTSIESAWSWFKANPKGYSR